MINLTGAYCSPRFLPLSGSLITGNLFCEQWFSKYGEIFSKVQSKIIWHWMVFFSLEFLVQSEYISQICSERYRQSTNQLIGDSSSNPAE
jgi:hypothetical protein